MNSSSDITLSTVVLMAGCDALVIGAPATILGNGVSREEIRSVEPFREVEISSMFEVSITIGPTPSITLLVDDNLLSMVETYVENERLFVKHAEGSNIVTSKPQKVTIVAPALTSIVTRGAAKLSIATLKNKSLMIDAAGASTVEVNQMDCDLVDLNADGAARITIAGKGKTLTVDASGSSRLSGTEATFESAKFLMEGAARCEVGVTGSASGELSGASTLTVSGGPTTRSVKATRAAHVYY